MNTWIKFKDENNNKRSIDATNYDRIEKQGDVCFELLTDNFYKVVKSTNKHRIRPNISDRKYTISKTFCLENTKERDIKYNEILEKLNNHKN